MSKWEYKVEINGMRTSTGEFEKKLNTLGLQEWELVSVTESENGDMTAFLKRRKP